MEATDCCRLRTAGRGRQLRQSTKDVRRRERLRLAVRSGTNGTASRPAQLGGSSCSRGRLHGPLLPSSGSRSGSTETASLPALSGPATRSASTSRVGRIVQQPYLNLVAITKPSLPAGIESIARRCHIGLGRT